MPEGGVGVFGPVLVAAVQKVKDDGAGDDGDEGVADLEAASGVAEGLGHARTGVEAVGGAAGEDEGVDGGDRLVGGEEVGFARSGRAAHDVDRSREGRVSGEDGDAGFEVGISGVADDRPATSVMRLRGPGFICSARRRLPSRRR